MAYQDRDTSWNYAINPANTPWLPGYRFCVKQRAVRISPRSTMSPRRYSVFFEINREGTLQHTGGPKPTIATLNAVQELYNRERPGSNYRPCDDELEDV